MANKIVRIGSGAAWWGDRVEPAILNADKGDLDYLCFETMAEATISAAQVRARRDPSFPGYDTYLDARISGVLPGCLKRGTKIITNQGWINPDAAAERIVYWLRKNGAKGVKVASVNGSLITERVLDLTDTILENGRPTSTLAPDLVSAAAVPVSTSLPEVPRKSAIAGIRAHHLDPGPKLAANLCNLILEFRSIRLFLFFISQQKVKPRQDGLPRFIAS